MNNHQSLDKELEECIRSYKRILKLTSSLEGGILNLLYKDKIYDEISNKVNSNIKKLEKFKNDELTGELSKEVLTLLKIMIEDNNAFIHKLEDCERKRNLKKVPVSVFKVLIITYSILIFIPDSLPLLKFVFFKENIYIFTIALLIAFPISTYFDLGVIEEGKKLVEKIKIIPQ